MNYNFDEPIRRRGTGCVKWDEAAADDIIPLWVADMDFPVAPAIQQAIRERAQHPVFGYTYVQDDYYAAVISWFRRRHDWHIKRQWLLYTIGVVPAMSVALKALTMPGERVLILSPDYNCFFSSIRNNGCEVAESVLRFVAASPAAAVAAPAAAPAAAAGTAAAAAEQRRTVAAAAPAVVGAAAPAAAVRASGFPPDGRFQVDWADFERQCADDKCTVFLLCNPHNPTGRVWSRDELQRMADICHRHHVRIVSDEIHCELVMPGHRYCPMGTVDPEAVILTSPSKSFNIAGLMMATIVCTDDATRRRLDRAININEVCDVNPFAPVAGMAAYNDSADWLDQLNAYIHANYTVLCDFVAQHLPRWRVMPMEGTYLAWVDVSACCTSVADYCDALLRDARVWLNAGTMYGPQSGEGFLRINLACPRSLLMEALERIARCPQ